ncbi:hypothetical protein EHI8A_040780 [Entamoeba histolytica HM-1:IMSS-B]|uniref:TLDc domain-containing protein n=6 Tax=Entamoeba histolytica TaxID=5759 RepID=C4M6D5_ENTH1|nr:hypothetical protein EHI_142880 [Entamoeba histolytica HM-1:IMSS]EMD47119.1 Hypothetical protein EHI5A_017340 [Entamoeba histolytica KU27]EMH75913.1 hypothetical protein EHI8A_040780 [Entamoeba histolytica HM-1:IMSS-B]EMS12905.1 hypothetical protein KM1_023400 [Entamoeba histolytica HM-3:IMSS]ENY62123.1 hypothetical protein EHI7A_041950 [Entamoeba histolytica HM-1:IMSS-A]GAT97037.1 hypothetical protein CL6EHI_142880 [Entamoeba histolytica]|eukprot:XP_650469.1 hypothetical protein EHI_142880 [Entamoeba histolytica HM-1:IMSS]
MSESHYKSIESIQKDMKLIIKELNEHNSDVKEVVQMSIYSKMMKTQQEYNEYEKAIKELEEMIEEKENLLNIHKNSIKILTEILLQYQNEINYLEQKENDEKEYYNTFIDKLIEIEETKKNNEINTIEQKYSNLKNEFELKKKQISNSHITIEQEEYEKENVNERKNIEINEKEITQPIEISNTINTNSIPKDINQLNEIEEEYDMYDETKFTGSVTTIVPPQFAQSSCKVVEPPHTLNKLPIKTIVPIDKQNIKQPINQQEKSIHINPQHVNQTEEQFEGINYIENWCGLKNHLILFDSSLPNGNSNETFASSVLNHSNIVILVFDSLGNIFGGYMKKPIQKTDSLIIDSNHFLFSLKKKNYLQPLQVLPKKDKLVGLYVHSTNKNELCYFGDEDNGWLSIQKTTIPKSVCCSLNMVYDIDNSMINGSNGEGFLIDRIVVLEMK